jgi:hypothetical protein
MGVISLTPMDITCDAHDDEGSNGFVSEVELTHRDKAPN